MPAPVLSAFFLAMVMAALGGTLAWLYLHRSLRQSELRITLLRADRRRLAARLAANKNRLSAGKRLVRRLGADNQRLGHTFEVLEAEHAALIVRFANLEAAVSSQVRSACVAADIETTGAKGCLETVTGDGQPPLPDRSCQPTVAMDTSTSSDMNTDTDTDTDTASGSLIAARDAEIRRLRQQLAPLLGLPLAIAAREAERDRLARRLALREDELRSINRLNRPEKEGEHLLKTALPEVAEGNTLALDVEQAVRNATPVYTEPLPRAEPPAEVDNLKRIRGIGPVLERMLNRLGVYQYRQIAAWTAEDVAWFDSELEEFRGRIERDGWVASAGIEHERKYGGPPDSV